MRSRQFSILLLFLAFPVTLIAAENRLAAQLEHTLKSKSVASYLKLVEPDPQTQAREKIAIEQVFAFPYDSVAFQLIDDKESTLLFNVFFRNESEARFESWSVKRVAAENGTELIQERKLVSSITGLYRLKLDSSSIKIRNFRFQHLDATYLLRRGELFYVLAGEQSAGVLFVGEGSFHFSPKDPIEQHQIKLFCKQSSLSATFKSFYFRSDEQELEKLFGALKNQPRTRSKEFYSRAQSLARDYNKDVYSVKLPLSDDSWFPQLKDGQVFSEVNSSLGNLYYQYVPWELEDVLLAHKNTNRIISLYNYEGTRDPVIAPDDFRVDAYSLKINYNPMALYMTASADVRLTSAAETSLIVFKLNPSLRVLRVNSSQGPLIYFHEQKTSNLHIVLNKILEPNDELSLQMIYSGKIEPEQSRNATQDESDGQPEYQLPSTYLYSNLSLWYPQLASRPYARLEARVKVPDNYVPILNGHLETIESGKGEVTYTYTNDQPLKYFSLLVGRLNSNLRKDSVVPVRVYYHNIDKKAAEQYGEETDKILRFFTQYFGPYPYKNLTLVLRPLKEPGGHGPATMAIVNRVFSYLNIRYRRDPMVFPDFPTLFLAHEIAHQWWGQAVGWRDYRDQWLSEGFAQFAATEYIRSQYGEKSWMKLSESFSSWIEDKTYAGPLILGSRLGHLTSDPQAYSALLYNKGAYVLNMLKNFMGNENFARCLSEFYNTYKFRLPSVADFQRIAQNHSDQNLEPFFDQWLYRWEIPVVRWSDSRDVKQSETVVRLSFTQSDKNFYTLKIPVEVKSKDGQSYSTVAVVDEPNEKIDLRIPFVPDTIQIDPQRQNLAKYEKS